MLKSNLEPIEESDLDLAGKFKNVESGKLPQENSGVQFEQQPEKAQEISAAEKDAAYGRILSKVQAPAKDNQVLDQQAVAEDVELGAAKAMDSEALVAHLLFVAEHKGVVHAVKVARKLQDNYALDTMHDRMLAEEFHDQLLAKGLIKEL